MSWAYTYCPACAAGLQRATVDEVLSGVQECPKCGRGVTPNRDRDDVLRDLANTVEAMEETLKAMKQ